MRPVLTVWCDQSNVGQSPAPNGVGALIPLESDSILRGGLSHRFGRLPMVDVAV